MIKYPNLVKAKMRYGRRETTEYHSGKGAKYLINMMNTHMRTDSGQGKGLREG